MTLSRRWVRGAVWIVMLMMGSVLAHAQDTFGSISGTVVDQTGASVEGAVVTVTNTDQNHVVRTAKTDKAGFYTATSLPVATYSVTVAGKGFKTDTVTGLVLNAHDQLKVNRKLSVGAATESVNVVADQAQLNLENGMSSGLVTGTQIRELVLNTRNYEQLLTLQPGVVYGGTASQLYMGVSTPAGTSATAAFSINGSRPTANNWTIDGADNVDRGTNLTLLTYPSVDAISQFVTLRGTYLAEYGRSASGQINVVTRSGTSAFHGGAYEFFRNDILNANNYFSNLVGGARPLLRYNDFGFNLGGPVWIPKVWDGRKHNTYFFYSQEFRRVVQYATTQPLAPLPYELKGDFSSAYVAGSSGATQAMAVCTQFNVNTGVCASNSSASPYGTHISQFSPTAQAYINNIYSKLPQPNVGANINAHLDPHTLTFNARNIFNNTQEFARVDQSFGTRVNLFYRFLHDSIPSQEGSGYGVGGGLPGVQNTSTRAPGTQHMGRATIAIHPTFLVNMGYAYSSGAVLSNPVGTVSTQVDAKNATPISSVQALPYASTLGIVPSLAFSGSGVPTGISSVGIYKDYSRNKNWFGDVTKIYKQHTFKFGVDYNHYEKTENATGQASPYPQGLFTFGSGNTTPTTSQLPAGTSVPSTFDNDWANFLIGNASGGSSNGFQQGSITAIPDITENLIELYAQDDWRMTRRLTVNLGVRYSYFSQPTDKNQRLSNFDPGQFTLANQETIDSNGQLCTTAGQTTAAFSGTTTVTTATNCLNVNGLNNYTPNAAADPLNGIILGNPQQVLAANLPTGAPSPFTHASAYGVQVGHAEKHDFAPRVGFALDVFGTGKTSLRGGFGMAYDDIAVSFYEQAIFNNPPFVSVANYQAARFDNPAGSLGVMNLSPPSLKAMPLNFQTPYTEQYSIDIQQALTPSMTLDVGLFGDRGVHLPGVVDVNEAAPGLFQQDGIANNGSGFRQINLGPVCTATTAACNFPPGQSSTGNLTQSNLYNVFSIPSCAGGFITSACENPLNQIRPYPGYNAINTMKTIFNSNYNGLQVKFTKRFSGRSMIDANYTWSKSLTNAQADYTVAPQNTYNLEPEYARSVYDRTNVLTIDGVWDLPWYRDQRGFIGKIAGGWEVSGIWAVNSGLPFTATSSGNTTIQYGGVTSAYNSSLTNGGLTTDSAGLGILGASAASLRPNQVLNPNSGYGLVAVHTAQHWFNPTAFVAPSPSSYQVGNERRNSINGPGFNQFDLGLFRTFRLYRQSTFTIRGEAFNVFNHTNWTGLCTTTGGCSGYAFGAVNAARDPRIMQVGGKVNF